MDTIRSGIISNLPISIKDVEDTLNSEGRHIATIQGKAQTSQRPHIPVIVINKYPQSEITLHMDIMFVDKDPYLISVSEVIDATMINYLGEDAPTKTKPRGSANIRNHIGIQISKYSGCGFHVTKIVCDREGAFINLIPQLEQLNIKVEAGAAASHPSGKIDRRIRSIKESVRCLLAALPYSLPTSLLKYAVMFAVSRFNLIRHSPGWSDGASPRELLFGLKTDFRRDCRVFFGEYCQCEVPYPDNSMKLRALSCIALYPTGSESGSVKFLVLKTMKVITRDKWESVPFPESIIRFMNNLAAKDSSPISRDPVFAVGDINTIIPDTDLLQHAPVGGPTNHIPSYIQPPLVPIRNISELHDNEVQEEPLQILPIPPSLPPIEREYPPSLHPVQNPTEIISPPIIQEPPIPPSPIEPHVLPLSELPQIQPNLLLDPPSIPSPPVTLPTNSIPQNEKRYNLRQNPKKKVFSNITVKEAILHHGPDAEAAIQNEINQMIDKAVWKPVINTGKFKKRSIPSSMFLTLKRNASGKPVKYKARLVAGGHRQLKDPSVSLHSPTMSASSMRTIAAIAASEHRKVITADVGGAYLNAKMKGTVLMTLSPFIVRRILNSFPDYNKFVNPDGSITVELLKALYGCIESAKLWFETICALLLKIDFTQNDADPCVFNRIESDGSQTTIGLYVDDLIMTSCNPSALNQIIDCMRSKFKEVTVHEGLLHDYLGMNLEFRQDGKVKIDMCGYIRKVLSANNISTTAKSPTSSNFSFNHPEDSPTLSESSMKSLHSTSAQLLYIASNARPDILFPVSYLTTRVGKYSEWDQEVAIHILRYLNGTINRCLTLCIPDTKNVTISLFADSSFHTHSDGKSHSGACISMGSGFVSWKSSKQSLTTKSSTEAELVAVSDQSALLFHAEKFLKGQGIIPTKKIIYQDNLSTIQLLKNKKSSSQRTAHINTKYFFLREKIEAKDIDIMHMPTAQMTADILTKSLQGRVYHYLSNLILGE